MIFEDNIPDSVSGQQSLRPSQHCLLMALNVNLGETDERALGHEVVEAAELGGTQYATV